MKQELKTAVEECQEFGGLPRCFLNERTIIQCPYMGKKEGYWHNSEEGVRINSFYSCLRYQRVMEESDERLEA